MADFINAHMFEILILCGNIFVAVINNGMKAKIKEIKSDISESQSASKLEISNLKTDLYKNFLTKDDFYSTVRDEKHRTI